MKRIEWELRRASWRLGNLGRLAVVVLVIAGVIAWVEVRPLQVDLAKRGEQLDARTVAMAHAPPPLPEAALDKASADQRFSVFLHSFHAIAARHGLVIPSAVYQAEPSDGTRLRRYLVEASFNSDYRQFRAFTADLRQLPGVRIEHLTLSRQDIGQTQLAIRIQCSLLVEVVS
ncbi:hypothetical protein [Lysobacter sp. GCM10012299]|jgi:hypothetical protein|uniref:hypothetical protein n=1 Tax=Lysobacter sp. GCM10012299 TaxID=3317333 RepID=UPI003610AAF3